MSLLQAKDLSVERSRRTVISGVSLALSPGEVMAIIGPNGAGKSSLLAAMAGLLPLSGGAVLLDGTPLAAMPPRTRARSIGYLPQQADMHWAMPVEAVVALGRLPYRGRRGGLSAADHHSVAQAIHETDVGHLAQRRVDQLSGGERARVLLARVLAGAPRVILADEPLANLDPLHQHQMLRLFRRMADQGAAVALVLHDLTAAARVADRAILLSAGRTAAEGAAQAVLQPEVLEPVFALPFIRQTSPAGPALFPKDRLR